MILLAMWVFAILFVITSVRLIGSMKACAVLKDHIRNNVSQLRNMDQDLRNAQGDYAVSREEVKRVTNKLIEVQNKATLVEKDAKERMAEFKSHPLIACMSDGQVTILAEMLAIHLRQILDSKKEYIN